MNFSGTKIKKIIVFALLAVLLSGMFLSWQTSLAAEETTEKATAATDVNNSMNTAAPQTDQEQANVAGQTVTTKTNEPFEWNMRLPVVFHIIGGVLYVALFILNKVVWLGAKLAEVVLSITVFTKAPVVVIGWQISRGLCNMLFAVILLIMSISTVLQIETFGAKKLLGRLVMAALLINFSLVFAGIIIDFAQVVTDYFIRAAVGDKGLAANLMNGLQVQRVYTFDAGVWEFFKGVVFGPTLQMIVEMLMAVVLFIVAAFSFFAMAFFLLARVVWIWFLLIIAPLAWVSLITPSLAKSLGGGWDNWWSQFFKWVFFAPVYAFFLYLALYIAQHGLGVSTNASMLEPGVARPFASSFFQTPGVILQYIVIIMILLGGLHTAEKAGVTGASKVYGWLKSMYKGTGHTLSRWAARGAPTPKFIAPALQKMGLTKQAAFWDRTVGKALKTAGAPVRMLAPLASPDVWRKAWAARKARAENRSFAQASGRLQDVISGKATWKSIKGEAPGFYENIERNKVIAQYQQEISAAMPDEKQRAQYFYETKNPQEKEAIGRIMAATNGINTLQEEGFKRALEASGLKGDWQTISKKELLLEEYGNVDKNITQLHDDFNAGKMNRADFTDKLTNLLEIKNSPPEFSKEDLKKEADDKGITALQDKYAIGEDFTGEKTVAAFQNLMRQNFGKKADRVGNDLANISTGIKNYSYTGSYKWDGEKGAAVAVTNNAEREAIVRQKFGEAEPQDLMRGMHPDSLFQKKFTVTHDGQITAKITGLSGSGKILFDMMNPLHYEQSNRLQGRSLSQTLNTEVQKAVKNSIQEEIKNYMESARKATDAIQAERYKKLTQHLQDLTVKYEDGVAAIAKKNKMTIDGHKLPPQKKSGGETKE